MANDPKIDIHFSKEDLHLILRALTTQAAVHSRAASSASKQLQYDIASVHTVKLNEVNYLKARIDNLELPI